jgi:hypothetical protein
MRISRITALMAGIVSAITGLVVSFFAAKGLGDLLFPEEIPGFSLGHAVLFLLAAVLVTVFLFFEAYRLFKAAESKRGQ